MNRHPSNFRAEPYMLAIIFAIVLLLGLRCRGQQYSNTVSATYNFSSFNQQSVNVRRLTITPLAPWQNFPWPGTSLPHLSNGLPLIGNFMGPSPVTFSVAQYPSMTNGTFTVTNLPTGIPFQVQMQDFYTNAYYTNYFSTNLAGLTLDASTNQAFVYGALIFPAGANGTNGVSGVTVTSGANITLTTNGTIITIASTGGGVTVAAGANVTLTTNGTVVTIASTGGGITVAAGANVTLTTNGTVVTIASSAGSTFDTGFFASGAGGTNGIPLSNSLVTMIQTQATNSTNETLAAVAAVGLNGTNYTQAATNALNVSQYALSSSLQTVSNIYQFGSITLSNLIGYQSTIWTNLDANLRLNLGGIIGTNGGTGVFTWIGGGAGIGITNNGVRQMMADTNGNGYFLGQFTNVGGVRINQANAGAGTNVFPLAILSSKNSTVEAIHGQNAAQGNSDLLGWIGTNGSYIIQINGGSGRASIIGFTEPTGYIAPASDVIYDMPPVASQTNNLSYIAVSCSNANVTLEYPAILGTSLTGPGDAAWAQPFGSIFGTSNSLTYKGTRVDGNDAKTLTITLVNHGSTFGAGGPTNFLVPPRSSWLMWTDSTNVYVSVTEFATNSPTSGQVKTYNGSGGVGWATPASTNILNANLLTWQGTTPGNLTNTLAPTNSPTLGGTVTLNGTVAGSAIAAITNGLLHTNVGGGASQVWVQDSANSTVPTNVLPAVSGTNLTGLATYNTTSSNAMATVVAAFNLVTSAVTNALNTILSGATNNFPGTNSSTPNYLPNYTLTGQGIIIVATGPTNKINVDTTLSNIDTQVATPLNLGGGTNIMANAFSYGTNGAASQVTNYTLNASTNVTTTITTVTNVNFSAITGGPGLFSVVITNINASGTIIAVSWATNMMPATQATTNGLTLAGTNWLMLYTNQPGTVFYMTFTKLTAGNTLSDIIYSWGIGSYGGAVYGTVTGAAADSAGVIASWAGGSTATITPTFSAAIQAWNAHGNTNDYVSSQSGQATNLTVSVLLATNTTFYGTTTNRGTLGSFTNNPIPQGNLTAGQAANWTNLATAGAGFACMGSVTLNGTFSATSVSSFGILYRWNSGNVFTNLYTVGNGTNGASKWTNNYPIELVDTNSLVSVTNIGPQTITVQASHLIGVP